MEWTFEILLLFYISRLSQQMNLRYSLVNGYSSVFLQTRLQIPNMDSDIFSIRQQKRAMWNSNREIMGHAIHWNLQQLFIGVEKILGINTATVGCNMWEYIWIGSRIQKIKCSVLHSWMEVSIIINFSRSYCINFMKENYISFISLLIPLSTKIKRLLLILRQIQVIPVQLASRVIAIWNL